MYVYIIAEPRNYRNRICMRGNRNPCNSFLMVKMASGMDHGRVCTVTTSTSPNMAAIQLIPSQAALQHISLILDIHMMFNWQLSYQAIRWPVSRDHIADSGLGLIKPTKCWFSIGSRANVRLTCWKKGRIVRKLVNANRGLTFSSMQMFLLLCFVYSLNSKQEAKKHTENLTAKLQNSNQNSTFSWVGLIGLWTTWPRSYAFRLA